MIGELRALGAAYGLLLGLVLASPLVAPGLLPWGVGALFILSGFQLRLADRRWAMRQRSIDWISHIRMAPARLLPWAAAAIVALIAKDQPMRPGAIIIAALLAELLIYPLFAPLAGRLSRAGVGIVLLLAIGASALAIGDTVRLVSGFTAGVSACIFWQRGPDGDLGELLLGLCGAAAAVMLAFLPSPISGAAPVAGLVCATFALAHLSIWRRRPLPWQRAGGGHGVMPARAVPSSRPS